MGLRNFLDAKIAPHFEKGGKLNRYYVFYEMFDTMVFSPSAVTGARTHVRDGLDLKRIMITVWLAAWPAMLFGMWNVGYQANLQIDLNGMMAIEGWRADIVMTLTGFDPSSFWSNMLHGAVYYLPIFVVTYLSGFLWEGLFAFVRGHEVNEGFFVTGILFTLILPPTIPLWMVFLGISFGVLIGKEVFGGTGKNFLNPALVGRAFLYFAYPAYMSGDAIWTAADNFTGATTLSLAQQGGVEKITEAGITWSDAFFGFIQGSIGETSTLAILIGAAILLITKIASWRIMLGVVLGMVATSLLLNLVGSDTNELFDVPWHWHLVMGGFMFGTVYMATDPVSAAHTNVG
ncbi:MAG: NADH:ubiquinone reductase (Na(+)-transporting) subunit B, partial [Pseudomonadota bacterium]|nr:NADH:ubiquinone reductase (Na(+)-transporting) subunit B [Pseudomonadota bacterium]